MMSGNRPRQAVVKPDFTEEEKDQFGSEMNLDFECIDSPERANDDEQTEEVKESPSEALKDGSSLFNMKSLMTSAFDKGLKAMQALKQDSISNILFTDRERKVAQKRLSEDFSKVPEG